MADEKNIYVAVDTDGFLAGAVVNDPEYKKDVAKDVALFIKRGCSVELMNRARFEAIPLRPALR